MIDLIAPVIISASFACWTQSIFASLVGNGASGGSSGSSGSGNVTSPLRLGLYTMAVVNTMLWTDIVVQRYFGNAKR